jgi:hypothetical protein
VPAHAQRMSSLLGADKEFAHCRSRKGGVYIMGGEVRAGRRERGYEAAATACTGPTLKRLGAKGTRGERTSNMLYMAVTLEVSQLSGWLKADACCRVEGRACDAGGRGASREGGGPGVVVAHKRHARGKGPAQQGLGAKGTRGAHSEHVLHVLDAGGVPAQRLVEGRRALPSRREGMRCGGERCEPGGGRA